MCIYKFRDLTDGHYCFILADSKEDAIDFLKEYTALEFEFVESRTIDEIKKPIFVRNDILAF